MSAHRSSALALFNAFPLQDKTVDFETYYKGLCPHFKPRASSVTDLTTTLPNLLLDYYNEVDRAEGAPKLTLGEFKERRIILQKDDAHVAKVKEWHNQIVDDASSHPKIVKMVAAAVKDPKKGPSFSDYLEISKLDPTTICTFVYGTSGKATPAHPAGQPCTSPANSLYKGLCTQHGEASLPEAEKKAAKAARIALNKAVAAATAQAKIDLAAKAIAPAPVALATK